MLPFELPSLNVLLLVSVLLYCVYKYLTLNFNYWKDRGIPFKKPLLVFGSYKDFLLLRASIGQIYTKMYAEYPNEKFVGGFRTRTPELLVKDPEFIRCVLVKDFSSFIERTKDVSDNVEKLNANLFTAHGDNWRAMRQKFTPIFTSGKLKNMFPLIVEKGEEFQKFLDTVVKEQDQPEVRELMARFTTDVIGSCAFGVRMNSMADSNAPFRRMGKQIFERSYLKTLKVFFRTFSPQLFDLFKLRLLPKQAEDFFINTVKEISEQRQNGNIKRHDFIDLLLDLKAKGFLNNDHGESKIEFTDDFMTAQAFIFFAAGFETSSTLMSFTLYELAKNPDVRENVLKEIDSVLEKNGGKLSYEAISEMHYLERVISEAMRKYPALTVLTRACKTKYTFPGTDLTIDAGVSIMVPVYAMHYDPQYYPDPEKFDPERFTAEAKQDRHPMVYLPFGEGPRNCIGLRFGKMQSMVGLVSLLSKFTVEPSPKTEMKIIIDPMSFVTSPKNGIYLNIKPRTKSH